MRSNGEVAELLLERLGDLAPAVTVEDGDYPWQVRVTMHIARNNHEERGQEMAEEEFRG